MKVYYRKRFLRDLAQLPPPIQADIERFVFEQFPRFVTPTESKVVEKLSGFPSLYKIRFGSYRVGLRIEGENVTFERVLHRKEIYRYFP